VASQPASVITVKIKGRMFVYVWKEKSNPEECKFGERFVFDGQDPKTECLKRVRESMGVRKDLFDTGEVELVAIWDVSELAERLGKNVARSRMDDHLRAMIGFRKGATGEIHTISAESMQYRVNRLLAKLAQPLPVAKFSTKQFEVATEVIEKFDAGNNVILAALCARFGKTIWSGGVAVETQADLIVVASYVKTVFTSFANDLTSFEQFASYEHVDASDPNYQTLIDDTLANNKKVFVYLSLANGPKRQSRIDFLFSRNVKTMLIVDEADFGAHQLGQAQPLVDKLDQIDYTIIMTGTNSDRAASIWPVDHVVSVTYPELLIQKKETENA
jgi:hypothetical protein